MPEPLVPTLVDLRNSVLIRGGYSVIGNQAAGMYPIVDEFLRSAQNELHKEAPWIREYKRTTQSLVTDQTDYDFPDDALMSSMGRISIINTDGNEFPLYAANGPGINNATKTSGAPTFVSYVNNIIRLKPAPTADWATLVYEYYAGPAPLVAETDRPTVDGECLIQRATYMLKRHTGLGGDWEAVRQEHLRYLKRTQEEQGIVRSISMRGAVPLKNDPRWYGTNRQPWQAGWNPWY